MADKETPAAPESSDKFSTHAGAPETQVGEGDTLSLDMGDAKPDRKVARNKQGTQASVGAGDDHDPELTDEERKALGEEGADDEGEPEDDGGEEAAEGDAGLPEFDPENAEVVKAYDARYLKDGAFNEQALGEEWYANATGKDGKIDLSKGGLNEATYKWFEAKGISRATVKSQERAVVALREKQYNDTLALAGGPDAFAAAVEWGRKGGYTEEQRAKFNAAVNGMDDEARQEAVEVLMSRYRRANPGKRRATPERTAATASQAPGGPSDPGFETYAEYSKALREARGLGDTKEGREKLAEVRRRYRNSDTASDRWARGRGFRG